MTKNMTLHTDKDLKSTSCKGKQYILPKDIDSKRKFKSKQKKMFALKRPIFSGHPNSGSCVQNA